MYLVISKSCGVGTATDRITIGAIGEEMEVIISKEILPNRGTIGVVIVVVVTRAVDGLTGMITLQKITPTEVVVTIITHGAATPMEIEVQTIR